MKQFGKLRAVLLSSVMVTIFISSSFLFASNEDKKKDVCEVISDLIANNVSTNNQLKKLQKDLNEFITNGKKNFDDNVMEYKSYFDDQILSHFRGKLYHKNGESGPFLQFGKESIKGNQNNIINNNQSNFSDLEKEIHEYYIEYILSKYNTDGKKPENLAAYATVTFKNKNNKQIGEQVMISNESSVSYIKNRNQNLKTSLDKVQKDLEKAENNLLKMTKNQEEPEEKQKQELENRQKELTKKVQRFNNFSILKHDRQIIFDEGFNYFSNKGIDDSIGKLFKAVKFYSERSQLVDNEFAIMYFLLKEREEICKRSLLGKIYESSFSNKTELFFKSNTTELIFRQGPKELVIKTTGDISEVLYNINGNTIQTIQLNKKINITKKDSTELTLSWEDNKNNQQEIKFTIKQQFNNSNDELKLDCYSVINDNIYNFISIKKGKITFKKSKKTETDEKTKTNNEEENIVLDFFELCEKKQEISKMEVKIFTYMDMCPCCYTTWDLLHDDISKSYNNIINNINIKLDCSVYSIKPYIALNHQFLEDMNIILRSDPKYSELQSNEEYKQLQKYKKSVRDKDDKDSYINALKIMKIILKALNMREDESENSSKWNEISKKFYRRRNKIDNNAKIKQYIDLDGVEAIQKFNRLHLGKKLSLEKLFRNGKGNNTKVNNSDKKTSSSNGNGKGNQTVNDYQKQYNYSSGFYSYGKVNNINNNFINDENKSPDLKGNSIRSNSDNNISLINNKRNRIEYDNNLRNLKGSEEYLSDSDFSDLYDDYNDDELSK